MAASTALVLMLLALLCRLEAQSQSQLPYSEMGVRDRFETRFVSTCSKYAFIDTFVKLLERPSDKYTIFVYNEQGANNNGGLGDRLAGLLSALAYSLRTGRNFLLRSDRGFERSFRRYHPAHLRTQPSHAPRSPHYNLTWDNWSTTGYRREYSQNTTYIQHCVNPKPSQKICALEHEYFPSSKVVKFRGNRAYLCRYALSKDSNGLRLLESMGVPNPAEADLFEVAGCMLRLVLWPTDLLWHTLDKMVEKSLSRLAIKSVEYQVALHFRCGDASFYVNEANINKGANALLSRREQQQQSKISTECVFTQGKSWAGTNFMDDFSKESPLDHAACGLKIVKQLQSRGKVKSIDNVLVYIASDSEASAAQMRGALQFQNSFSAFASCHVDIKLDDMCSATTIAQWLLLSLSDAIVMQSMLKTSAGAIYRDPSAPPGHVAQEVPISAFSRYASMYALAPDVMHYGLSCGAGRVNKTYLSKQTQGNWVCNPRVFF